MSTTIHENPVRSNADLFRLWQELMGEGRFARRSLWLTLLEEDGRPAKLIVPIDDIPDRPDDELLTNLHYIVDRMCSDLGLASVPMLLSRPGPSTMTESDREWARDLMAAMGERHRWPLHLATDNRIQVFAPDDLV